MIHQIKNLQYGDNEHTTESIYVPCHSCVIMVRDYIFNVMKTFSEDKSGIKRMACIVFFCTIEDCGVHLAQCRNFGKFLVRSIGVHVYYLQRIVHHKQKQQELS